MSLPIAKYPMYDIEVPSTKQKIKFRPFLVKEHKIILQSIEFKDADNFINSILNIVDSCTFNKLNISELTVYDVDYIFLHLRAKSVGENVPVQYRCMANIETFDEEENDLIYNICDTKINVNLDLNQIKVSFPPEFEKNKIVMVDENIGMKLKVPNFEQFKKLDKVDNVGKMFSVTERFIFDCVENIFDAGAVMLPGKDFDIKEFIEFLENLPFEAVQKINRFFESMPHISLAVAIRCPKCGSMDNIELKTLDDFFV